MSNTLFKHFEWVVNSYGDSIDNVELRMNMDQGDVEKLMTPVNGVLEILPVIDIAADFFPRIKDGGNVAETFFKKIVDGDYRLEATNPSVGIKQLGQINKQLNEKDIVSSTYRGRYSTIGEIGNVYLRKAYISIYRNFLDCSKSDIERNSDNYHILKEPRIAELPTVNTLVSPIKPASPTLMNPLIPDDVAAMLKKMVVKKEEPVVEEPVVESPIVEVVEPVSPVEPEADPFELISDIILGSLEAINHTPSSIAELASVSSNRFFSILKPRGGIFSLWRLKSLGDTFRDIMPSIDEMIGRVFTVLEESDVEIVISLKTGTIDDKRTWDAILSKFPKGELGRSTKATFRIDKNTSPYARRSVLQSFKETFIMSTDRPALEAIKVSNLKDSVASGDIETATPVQPVPEVEIDDDLLDMEFGETPLLRGGEVVEEEEKDDTTGGVRTTTLDWNEIVNSRTSPVSTTPAPPAPSPTEPQVGIVINEKDVALRTFIKDTIRSSNGNFKEIGKAITIYLALED